MTDDAHKPDHSTEPSRRRFLRQVGQRTVAAGTTAAMLNGLGGASAAEASDRQVKRRVLGKTGLKVSEIGIGGHSWAYKQVPDGSGGMRVPTVDEAVEMIAAAMEMGVNFLDSCSALSESSTPGEALKRLKARDKFIVSIRVSHKMKGRKQDQEEIYKWTEDRLKLWQTDCVDLCLLCNTENDTPESGYWDMSYSIEALDKLKQQGKIRYTGFGCHFTPALFLKAFDKFGDDFDICSIPYNVRHIAAKTILPAAKKKKLGVITIKPFARGSLLKKRDLAGADAGLPRDMISYVLEDENVDCCTCGVHTVEQVRENFSASWTGLTPDRRERLGLAAATPCPGYRWLEEGWRYV
ncbi:MAG: aldo/keto reductase [Candidatus Nealsonbacteria bacterium]|nr:aldo/keto reductase [Candidatus Nealsonbacteria bacterium]